MTTCRFILPGIFLVRLATLILVTEQSQPRSVLTHIALSLRGDLARFAATDGKILAVLRTDIQERQGADSLDLILDAAQLTDAAKAQAKVRAQTVVVVIDTDAKEVRIGSMHAAGLVTLRDGMFPSFEAVFTKYQGGAWVPAISAYDPRYLTLLPKLTGKPTVLLRSVTHDGDAVAPLWPSASPRVTVGDIPATVPISVVTKLTSSPGWYCDHELLVLIMPISHPSVDGIASFEEFMLPLVPAENTAATNGAVHASAA